MLNVKPIIASKVIATKCTIEHVLPSLIHTEQTAGFMKSRFIGQNVQLVNLILEQSELQEISGNLFCRNFQKAFFTVKWSYIQTMLSPFKFGSGIKRWISTFYTNAGGSVLNNGFCTDHFKISRGVTRNGCPLFPYWALFATKVL